MNKKIIGVFVFMLMTTVALSAANSTTKIEDKQTYVESVVNEGCKCNQYNGINAKVKGNIFPNYPTMKDYLVSLDQSEASPKPKRMETPSEFSWLNYDGQDWTTPAKKQLCGDCWDFAAIGVLESIVKIREGCAELTPDLSEQYVLSCLPGAGSCHGGDTYEALQLMMENTSEGDYYNGALPESCFPYQGDDTVPCSDKCPNWIDNLVPLLDCGYFRTDGSPEDREAIKAQIMLTGPVAAGIKATDFLKIWGSLNHNPDAYFHYIRKVTFINHIVLIVGWKDDSSIRKGGYWICKNSWGSDWGYQGFFNIEYNALNIDNSMIAWADYDSESFDWAPIANAGGLYFGDIGEQITFDASNSFDPEENIVSYNWDFGDGTNGTGVTTTHTYSQQGIYPVSLIVTDSEGKSGNDATWAGIEESIDSPNSPTITGPASGTPGVEYDYTFVTTDPNGDDVYYWVEWGTYYSLGGWIGPYASGEQITLSYTWNGKGTYSVRAKAKDVYDQESDWSYLEVSMPINQQKTQSQQSSPLANQQIISQRHSNQMIFKILQNLPNMR